MLKKIGNDQVAILPGFMVTSIDYVHFFTIIWWYSGLIHYTTDLAISAERASRLLSTVAWFSSAYFIRLGLIMRLLGALTILLILVIQLKLTFRVCLLNILWSGCPGGKYLSISLRKCLPTLVWHFDWKGDWTMSLCVTISFFSSYCGHICPFGTLLFLFSHCLSVLDSILAQSLRRHLCLTTELISFWIQWQECAFEL